MAEPTPAAPKQKVHKTDAEWRELLSPEQFHIMRQKGTEPAFTGALVDNHDDGMYHCAACNAPLFTADKKFDSGSGWPRTPRTACVESRSPVPPAAPISATSSPMVPGLPACAIASTAHPSPLRRNNHLRPQQHEKPRPPEQSGPCLFAASANDQSQLSTP
jgi:hypothetical protein